MKRYALALLILVVTVSVSSPARTCVEYTSGGVGPDIWVLYTPGYAEITFQNYTTFGSLEGEFCVCALKKVSSIQSIDLITISFPMMDDTLFVFLEHAVTSSDASVLLDGPAVGFLGETFQELPPSQPVDVKFQVTLFAGVSFFDLKTDLETGSGFAVGQAASSLVIVTDAGNSDGTFAGGHLGMFPAGNILLDPTSTGVGDYAPQSSVLHQNYPNPFNPSTTISYELAAPAHVVIEIFDVEGREIRTVADLFEEAGDRSVIWDGMNNAGQSVGSGVYFYRLTTGDFIATKRLVLLR